MKNNKNRQGFACLAMLAMAAVPWADDALSLDKIADLSFGTIDYDTPTGAGNVIMGSNGSVTYGTNTSGSGFGTPGQLQVTGPEDTTVSISCSADTNLSLPGTGTLTVTPVTFAIGSANTGTAVSDIPCQGLAQPSATHTIAADASENLIIIGGTLNTDNQALGNGQFTSGGNGPSFLILVQ